MDLSNEAKQLRNEYYRKYREKNKERIRDNNYHWRKNNKERIKGYARKYWESKVSE